MQKFLLIVATSATVLMGSFPAGAAIKHYRHRHYASPPATNVYAAQPEIACTKGGCIPVPPGCHAAIGRTPNGTATSFDVAVCGNYTLYGNR